jgi:DNA adenine methylase
MLLKAEKNDFIYLDPPYDKSFDGYTPDGFGPENQKQLASVFRELSNRGCLVLLSNSDTPRIRELYSDFNIKQVDDVSRSVNSFNIKQIEKVPNYLFGRELVKPGR